MTSKKLTIVLDNGHTTIIAENTVGQDLYVSLVALIAHISPRLNNPTDGIDALVLTALQDAKKIIADTEN